MCFPRVPVIVIVILRYGSGEGLLKYINVGDKSTMVARLPQQVFLLLVLVTGTTMGIGICGMGLTKSTKSSHPTDIRQDGTSGNHQSKKIPHKTVSRLEEASNFQIPIPKSYSVNIQTKSFDDRKFTSGNEEMHHKNMKSKLRSEEWKNDNPRDKNALPLLSPSTDRVELQSISRKDGFVRLQGEETLTTSSSSAFYHSLEDPPSLRSRRTSGSFLLSTPTSHPLSRPSSSMTSSFSSNDMPNTSASSRSLTSGVSFSSPDDYPKTTIPNSSTSTNGIPVTRVLELDNKISKSIDQIENEEMVSSEIEVPKMERFSNEFTKITKPILSTRTHSIPDSQVLQLDNKFSEGPDQIEDDISGNSEIEDSKVESSLNEFIKTTQPSLSSYSIPVSQVLKLDNKFSKGPDQIDDEITGSIEIENSKVDRFSNEFTKITQPSLSTRTHSMPVSGVLKLDNEFSKNVDQIKGEMLGSSEIEDFKVDRSSNEFTKTIQPSLRTYSIPVSRVLKLDNKFSKGPDQIEDEITGSSETEDFKVERSSNEFTKTTQPSLGTYSIPVSQVLKLDNKFSKDADQFEDQLIEDSKIEVTKVERFSNEFTTTTQSSSGIGTNSISASRALKLDNKLSKGADQIEDETMESSEVKDSMLETFSNEFTKTTQSSLSTRTNSIPIHRDIKSDNKFSKGADQIDDEIMGSNDIENIKLDTISNKFSKILRPRLTSSTKSIAVSRILELNDKFIKGKKIGSREMEVLNLKWFPNEFSETTTLSLSASISSIPLSHTPKLAKKMSNDIVQIEDRKMGNSQIEDSNFPIKFPNKLHSFGTRQRILTTELATETLNIAHENKMKYSMRQFTGNKNEIRHFDGIIGNRAALTAITLPQTTGFGFPRRYTRDSPEIDLCESFEIGDPVKKEFYSPNYPEIYPPLTNCVLVLEAEKGQLLKLDFRETFELEARTPDGECRFDYLEVRDGQYGFSPKIGTYCDKTFPPEIISQSRYLWLNFHSDDTIEYQGFKAVWSTVPRPNTDAIQMEQEPCIYYEDIPADFELKSDMIKDAKKISETNRVALDCLWVLKAAPMMKMQLTFDSFKLEKPNDCSANFLDIFDGETDEPSRVKKFCGSIAEALSTKTNRMYVRLYLEPKAINSSFAALITAVRDKDANQANCKPNEFDCQDATCIALSLRCNSRKNCRFQGDEAPAECGTSSEKQDRSRIVIILVIFSLIMFGMCTAFVFNCVRKLRRDHRIIREHIRQSREDRLDEIGRRATPCPLSVSRTDLRDGGSESPAGEEVDSSKELIPAATLSTREYTKELTLKMKYGTKEITDIHQSNNVSNATQERLQESSEEPDMCDSSCQTRESLFAPIIPDAILSSPAFSTFGYETIAGPENELSHKGTPTSDQSYRHHRHQHQPTPLKQTSQRSQESHRKNSQVSGYPISERCSHEGSVQICPKHNPIPAPPGWSLHDPPYPQIVPESSSYPEGGDNSSYRRYHSPKPDHDSSIGPSIYQQHQYQYPPPVFTRQNTVGSGERYGSYIYGSGRASSNTASSNATTTSATTTPTTSNTTGSGSPHLATPKHSKTDPRYRAEAVIEVDQKRPFSIESTKSAPDVIATH